MNDINQTIAEPYVNEQIRMSWPRICNIACYCLIHKMTIETYVEKALKQEQERYIASIKHNPKPVQLPIKKPNNHKVISAIAKAALSVKPYK